MASILIVDDLAAVRTVLRTFLEVAGHLVHEAPSGVSALNLLRRLPLDLLMVDSNMPGMDGLTLLEIFRRDFESTATRTILITGDPDSVTGSDGRINSGPADRVLIKPFEMATLLLHVTEELREGRRVQAERDALPAST